MISIAIFLVFMSFYMFLNTSKIGVKHVGFGFEFWIERHQNFGRLMASIIIAAAIFMYVYLFGLGSGILIFLITQMCLGSIIVLLTPLRLITRKIVLFVFVSCFCLETFLL
jgi:hypothetical protein